MVGEKNNIMDTNTRFDTDSSNSTYGLECRSVFRARGNIKTTFYPGFFLIWNRSDRDPCNTNRNNDDNSKS